MDIMVIGGGGREHAIVHFLRQSPRAGHIYALPGNGGLAQLAECVPIKATDLDAIVEFARLHPVQLAVVAQDDPLALGLVDRLHELGVACFGPTAAAARIEGSKSFAKQLMKEHGIPTAAWEAFDNVEAALDYAQRSAYPLVVKADGLALGKGVTIAADFDEAAAAIRHAMVEKAFGESGAKVVIEEFLRGPEVTVLALTDGTTIRPLSSSMDHKQVGEGGTGPNTGGMGVIAPNPFYTPQMAERCMREIFQPTLAAMRELGCPFQGCLYFGLMLTEQGPKVIEYNCRFGDPEAQAVLPLLEGDLLELMLSVEEGCLDKVQLRTRDAASCCVVLASGGYPGAYEKGKEISGIDAAQAAGALVFHAGTKRDGERLLTNGGRVLGVVATADTLPAAVEKAYAAAAQVTFDNAFCRRDIGAAACAELHKH